MEINHINSSKNELKWKFIKIPFIIVVFILFKYALFGITSFSINRGFCQLMSCNWVLIDWVKYFLLLLFVLFSALYILEKKMIIATLSISVLLFIVLSAHESYGVQLRTGILPLIFLSQSAAYFIRKKEKLTSHNTDLRISIPIQVIVACYTLAGISKLIQDGFSWFLDSKFIVLQMLKSNQTHYFDGRIDYSEIYSPLIEFVLNNPILLSALLLGALIIELSSGLAIINKKLRLIYGFLLLAMHIGIWFFFDIRIVSFIVPMILFMINPLWLGYSSIQKLKTRIKSLQ